MKTQLVRLQIPNNWTVSDNKFYDVDPSYDANGQIINWHEGFSDDVLWIQQSFFSGGKYQSPTNYCFDIELSWASNQYLARLKYTNNKSSYTIEKIESHDRNQIRDKIEFWLINISNNLKKYRERYRHKFPDET